LTFSASQQFNATVEAVSNNQKPRNLFIRDSMNNVYDGRKEIRPDGSETTIYPECLCVYGFRVPVTSPPTDVHNGERYTDEIELLPIVDKMVGIDEPALLGERHRRIGDTRGVTYVANGTTSIFTWGGPWTGTDGSPALDAGDVASRGGFKIPTPDSDQVQTLLRLAQRINAQDQVGTWVICYTHAEDDPERKPWTLSSMARIG